MLALPRDIKQCLLNMIFTHNDYLEYCRDGLEYKLFKQIEALPSVFYKPTFPCWPKIFYLTDKLKNQLHIYTHVILKCIFKGQCIYLTVKGQIYAILRELFPHLSMSSPYNISRKAKSYYRARIYSVKISPGSFNLKYKNYSLFVLWILKQLRLPRDLYRKILPQCRVYLPKISNGAITAYIRKRRKL